MIVQVKYRKYRLRADAFTSASLCCYQHHTCYVLFARRYTVDDMGARKYYVLDVDVPRIPAADFDDDLGDGALDDPSTAQRPRVCVDMPEPLPGVIPLVDPFPTAPEVRARLFVCVCACVRVCVREGRCMLVSENNYEKKPDLTVYF